MQLDLKDMNEFDQLLVQTVDEVLQECLGSTNAQIILEYLDRRSCPAREIPQKLDIFSNELRKLLGFGRGPFIGCAAVLEETIARVLCSKLGVRFNGTPPIVFSEYITNLRETYRAKERIDGLTFSEKEESSMSSKVEG